MTILPIYDPPDYDRPLLDYDLQQDIAAQMRTEKVRNALSGWTSTMAPSRRSLRTFGLAFLLATGAFWAVMLQDPPKTVAADPSTSDRPLSPLDLKVSFDLPTGDYIAN